MFFRRSTHPSETDLSAYVDGELDMAKARRLAAHLEGCGECRRAIEELRETKTLMADLPRAPLSRSFVLSAAQAGVQAARPAPARPNALRFAPALSLAVLAVLLVVDIATPGGSSQSTSSANHGGLVAKSASESADSIAGRTLEAAPNTTLLAPRAAPNNDAGVPGSTAPSASAAVIPPVPAPSLGNQAAPSAPSTQSQAGAAASPPQPQILTAPDGRSAGGAPPPLVPPVAIQPFGATVPAGGAGAAAGAAPAATPQAAAAPQSAGSNPVVPVAPQPGVLATPQVATAPSFNPVTPVVPQPGALNPVAPAPAPGQNTSVTVASKSDSGGSSLLRVLEILAAAAFIVSLLVVLWPRLTRKER